MQIDFNHRADADLLRQIRESRRESQTDFWKRFGVTQSCGSRFENGFGIPEPIAILIALYLDKRVDDADLRDVKVRFLPMEYSGRRKPASTRRN